MIWSHETFNVNGFFCKWVTLKASFDTHVFMWFLWHFWCFGNNICHCNSHDQVLLIDFTPELLPEVWWTGKWRPCHIVHYTCQSYWNTLLVMVRLKFCYIIENFCLFLLHTFCLLMVYFSPFVCLTVHTVW